MRARHCLDLLVYIAALVSTAAWARDIEHAPTRPSVGRAVWRHTIPNYEHYNVVAQSQAPLGGAEPGARLAPWRQSRTACTDIRCIDMALGKLKTKTSAVESKTAAAPAADMASASEPAPVAAASSADAVLSDGDSLSASAASPPSGASQARQGSGAGATPPQPPASNVLSAKVSSSANSVNESGRGRGLTGVLAALIAIAIILSAFIIRRNKALGITTNYQRARGKKRR
ncbi:hypothetical protein BZM26_34985 [Paraburkholderia strydomiana]|nr:hypothetical protein BZM26_34985 [Paraburkholderia strydomiana]